MEYGAKPRVRMEVEDRILSWEETSNRSGLTYLPITDHRYEPRMKRKRRAENGES